MKDLREIFLKRWPGVDDSGSGLIELTAVFSILAALTTGIFSSFAPGWGMVVLLLQVVLAAILIVFFFVHAIVAAVTKKGKATIAFLATGLIIGYIDVFPSIAFFSYVGDYIHLAILYPYYLSKVKDRQLAFSWGLSGMVGTAETERVLTYDSDGSLKSEPKQEFRQADGATISVRRDQLFGNFFVVETSVY